MKEIYSQREEFAVGGEKNKRKKFALGEGEKNKRKKIALGEGEKNKRKKIALGEANSFLKEQNTYVEPGKTKMSELLSMKVYQITLRCPYILGHFKI